MLRREDGQIDWSEPATHIERQIRAYTPWPGTFSTWNEQTLKIIEGRAVDGTAPQGSVVRAGDGIAVGTGAGLLQVSRLQLQGKRAVSAFEFVQGHDAFLGATLG